MKFHAVQLLIISMALGLGIQTTQAAAISSSSNVATSQIMKDKLSPIEKALSQQKRDNKVFSNQDDIKVFASLKTAASQNFLAEQHQRFSRFVQAIFQPHSS